MFAQKTLKVDQMDCYSNIQFYILCFNLMIFCIKLYNTLFVSGGMDIVELNERCRFLLYAPGQKFLSHKDGCYMRPQGEKGNE